MVFSFDRPVSIETDERQCVYVPMQITKRTTSMPLGFSTLLVVLSPLPCRTVSAVEPVRSPLPDMVFISVLGYPSPKKLLLTKARAVLLDRCSGLS